MTSRPLYKRKVYPQNKDLTLNGDITHIIARCSPTPKKSPPSKRYNKSPSIKPSERAFSIERGCLPSSKNSNSNINNNINHVMPVVEGGEIVQRNQTPNGIRDFQEMPIEECRQIYKDEINTLWREVEDFRQTCQKEMMRQRTLLDEHRKKCEEALKNELSVPRAPDVTEDKDYTTELKSLKENMQILEQKQKLLDQEEQLVEREEQLAKRQEKLKEYEKDVEEAEALLDKRQNVVKRRSQDVEFLNHDLLTIKQELEDSIEKAEENMDSTDISKTDDTSEEQTSYSSTLINSPETSCKARRNWQLARRHLIDKVTLLETTIQRYRTQVASSSATITAKDMVISRLQKDVSELRDDLELKDKKIKKLESQLALSLEDKTRSERKLEMLLEELQNIDLNATAKVLSSPEKTPSKNDTTNKRKFLKKQHSMFSFLAHHIGDKSDRNYHSTSPGLIRRRTFLDKENAKSGPNTPVKVVPNNNGRTDEIRSESVNSDGNERKIDAGAKADDSYSLSELEGDLGSKACSVM